MAVFKYALEIHVYTADGGEHRFYTDRDEDVRKVLTGFQPNRLFTQKQFIVAGSYFMAGFSTATVTRVDFIGQHVPTSLPYLGELTSVEEVSDHEMEKRALPRIDDPLRTELSSRMGETLELFAEFQMVDGKRVCVRMLLKAGARVDQRQTVQNIINQTGFHILARSGGLIVINPPMIARWAIYPGMPEAPANSWPLHRLDLSAQHEESPSLIFARPSLEDLRLNPDDVPRPPR